MAEKEVHCAELLSHHRSWNCKQNHFIKFSIQLYSFIYLSICCFCLMKKKFLHRRGVYYTSYYPSDNYLSTTCFHGQQIKLEGIFTLISVSYCALSKPNKSPAKLNLLTCQVKPSLEDKKCFDLISRK